MGKTWAKPYIWTLKQIHWVSLPHQRYAGPLLGQGRAMPSYPAGILWCRRADAPPSCLGAAGVTAITLNLRSTAWLSAAAACVSPDVSWEEVNLSANQHIVSFSLSLLNSCQTHKLNRWLDALARMDYRSLWGDCIGRASCSFSLTSCWLFWAHWALKLFFNSPSVSPESTEPW